LVDVSLTVSPIRNDKGDVVGASQIARDITQSRLAAEMLRTANRRKDEFLALLAHELRNPLAPIVMSLENLRRMRMLEAIDEPETPPTERPADRSLGTRIDLRHRADAVMDVLERQVGQMVRLVDDLLDAGRISSGKIALRREHVELSPVIYHAVEAARLLSDTRGQELTVTLPAEPIVVNADSTRLAQVIGNLLNNASKFTDCGGHIWLTVERENEPRAGDVEPTCRRSPGVAIRVRDTGIGIAEDQIPYVFEMFTQLDTSLERSVGGLGIGLNLVKTLTQLHGGAVEVSSAGIGQGSEFVVRLPIVVESATLTEASRPAEPAARPLRVLIVDDSQDATDMLATFLALAGHETHTAHDGVAAIEATAKLQPDIVLLDIGLPGLNGYEAARRIRQWQSDKDRRPVLVALSGWGQDEDRRRSQEAGFDAHLIKPVDAVVLGNLLATLVAV
jgi:signal transduction histidine kinase